MEELFHIVEEAGRCPYLPGEQSRFDLRGISSMTAAEYGDLLAQGYRRFGWQVFRPVCEACSECRSLRIPVRQFEPGAGARRVLRANRDIRAELTRLFISDEHVDLYNRYQHFMHGHRQWDRRWATERSLRDQVLSGARDVGKQWLYFDRSQLVGVAFMDEAPGAISLVYCFYDPEWRKKSPGTYSILRQLLYARERGLDYAYLGYWVKDCQSLAYKQRFRPHEILAGYPAPGEPAQWLKVE